MALSSYNRLTRAQIKRFFKGARRLDFELGRLYIKNKALTGVRLGVVVPKSVSKKSTVRNTLKRRTAEWVRHNIVPKKPRMDIIVSLNKKAGSISRTRFYRELEKVFYSINSSV